MRRFLASLLFLAAVPLSSCSLQAILETAVGPFTYTVSSSRIMIPAEFQDTSTGTVRSVPCQTDATCPSLGAGQPAVHCVASLCDPDPFFFELSSNPIDLAQNATVQRYGDHVTSLSVTQAQFEATNQGLSIGVGPTQIFWGPNSAVDTMSAGVHLFGTIPVVQVPAGSSVGPTAIELDAAGGAALSDHLLHVSRVIRLFARPSVDLAPGTPLPSGDLRLDITIQVHIEGQLVQ